MKVLVCGGRNYDPLKAEAWLVEYYSDKEKPIEIIEGGASGADMGGLYFGNHSGIPVKTFKAEWNKYGKSAGFRRNQRMLEEGMPEFVIAFPGGKGTQNMINLAEKAGVEVYVVDTTKTP